ncbi:kelch-like protein 17 [Gigaspora margarita]|uniref:Kelch-like protein 17 n=1 Tax=Gigaspora margarita TaxID=4874 RepID=A0A8H4AGZ0_GIGMA|nr:kelch-like protein 17 [Gigaspora margarita]
MFKLLFRETRDGFTKIHFETHLVVTKVKDTDETLGGYNPIIWDKLAEDLRPKMGEASESSLLKSLATSLFESIEGWPGLLKPSLVVLRLEDLGPKMVEASESSLLKSSAASLFESIEGWSFR